MSWEDVVDAIAFHSLEDGHIIDSFYGQCLRFNRPQPRGRLPKGAAARPAQVRGRQDHGHSRVVGRLLKGSEEIDSR